MHFKIVLLLIIVGIIEDNFDVVRINFVPSGGSSIIFNKEFDELTLSFSASWIQIILFSTFR